MPAQKVSPISNLSLPLALRDAGDPELYTEAAERNVQEMHDMAVSINENLIPGINAAVDPLNTLVDNLPAVQNAAANATTATKKAAEAASSATAAAGSATTAGTKASAAAASATASAGSATAANTAKVAAEAAQTGAETANEAAEAAQTGAKIAQIAAKSAQTGAEIAKTAAETAKTAAQTAEGAALASKNAAATSATASAGSATAANIAKTGADAAKVAAEKARDAAQAVVTDGIPDASTTVKGLVQYGTAAGTAAQGNHGHAAQTTITGNAGTATKLKTARAISLTGAVTGSVSFDGSANASMETVIAGGGGATVVSTPVIDLGELIAVGLPVDFTASATPLLSGGRKIAHFLLSIPELGIADKLFAANNNAAMFTFIVPVGTAINTLCNVIVTAVDDMGNASAEAKKVVLTAAAFVKSPAIEAPVAGAKVNSTALIFATGPFGVTGTTDTHTASQYRLRAVADGATVYDSGEVVSLLTLTADVSDVVAEDVDYIAEARHKGKKLGWSAWGAGNGVSFYVYNMKGKVAAVDSSSFIIGDDFTKFPANKAVPALFHFPYYGRIRLKEWYYIIKDHDLKNFSLQRTRDFVDFEEIALPSGVDRGYGVKVHITQSNLFIADVNTHSEVNKKSIIYKMLEDTTFVQHAVVSVVNTTKSGHIIHIGSSANDTLYCSFYECDIDQRNQVQYTYKISPIGNVVRLSTLDGYSVTALRGAGFQDFTYASKYVDGLKTTLLKLSDSSNSPETIITNIGQYGSLFVRAGKVFYIDSGILKYLNGNTFIPVPGISTILNYNEYTIDDNDPLCLYNNTDGLCTIDKDLKVTNIASVEKGWGCAPNVYIDGEITSFENTSRCVFRDGKWQSLADGWTCFNLVDGYKFKTLPVSATARILNLKRFNGKIYAISIALKQLVRIDDGGIVTPLLDVDEPCPLDVFGGVLTTGKYYMTADEKFNLVSSDDGENFVKGFDSLKVVNGKLFLGRKSGSYYCLYASGDGKRVSKVLNTNGEYGASDVIITAFNNAYIFINSSDGKVYQSTTGTSGWASVGTAISSPPISPLSLDVVEDLLVLHVVNSIYISNSPSSSFIKQNETFTLPSMGYETNSFMLDGKSFVSSGNALFCGKPSSGWNALQLHFTNCYAGKLDGDA